MPTLTRKTLTFLELLTKHRERCKRWHSGGTRPWSAAEWTNAIAGEVGEAANTAKKLLRVETGLRNPDQRDAYPTEEKYKDAMVKELADTIHYCVLAADAIDRGGMLEVALVETFNAKSVENNFPERLHLWRSTDAA